MLVQTLYHGIQSVIVSFIYTREISLGILRFFFVILLLFKMSAITFRCTLCDSRLKGKEPTILLRSVCVFVTFTTSHDHSLSELLECLMIFWSYVTQYTGLTKLIASTDQYIVQFQDFKFKRWFCVLFLQFILTIERKMKNLLTFTTNARCETTYVFRTRTNGQEEQSERDVYAFRERNKPDDGI